MRALAILLLIAACQSDETVTAYGGAGEWQLQQINDQAFQASASLSLSDNGAVSGQAPCNSYSATQSAPYPWFDLSPIAATKRACDGLQAETQFFAALEAMSLAEVSGAVLILSNDDGDSMLFGRSGDPVSSGGD